MRRGEEGRKKDGGQGERDREQKERTERDMMGEESTFSQ